MQGEPMSRPMDDSEPDGGFDRLFLSKSTKSKIELQTHDDFLDTPYPHSLMEGSKLGSVNAESEPDQQRIESAIVHSQVTCCESEVINLQSELSLGKHMDITALYTDSAPMNDIHSSNVNFGSTDRLNATTSLDVHGLCKQDQWSPSQQVRVTCGARHSILEISKESSINDSISVQFSLRRPFILQTWNEQSKRFVNVLSTDDPAEMSQLHVITLPASIPVTRFNDCLTVSLTVPKMKVNGAVLSVESAAAIVPVTSTDTETRLNSESSDCHGRTESDVCLLQQQQQRQEQQHPCVLLNDEMMNKLAPETYSDARSMINDEDIHARCAQAERTSMNNDGDIHASCAVADKTTYVGLSDELNTPTECVTHTIDGPKDSHDLKQAKRVKVTCGMAKKFVEIHDDSDLITTLSELFSLQQPFILQTWNEVLRCFVNVFSTCDVVDASQLDVITLTDTYSAVDFDKLFITKLDLPNILTRETEFGVSGVARHDTDGCTFADRCDDEEPFRRQSDTVAIRTGSNPECIMLTSESDVEAAVGRDLHVANDDQRVSSTDDKNRSNITEDVPLAYDLRNVVDFGDTSPNKKCDNVARLAGLRHFRVHGDKDTHNTLASSSSFSRQFTMKRSRTAIDVVSLKTAKRHKSAVYTKPSLNGCISLYTCIPANAACLYCDVFLLRADFEAHMISEHSFETEVQRLKKHTKHSSGRRMLLCQLANDGTFLHNTVFFKTGEGEFVIPQNLPVVREQDALSKRLRYQPDRNDAIKYLPCPFCKKFVWKRLLNHHVWNGYERNQELYHRIKYNVKRTNYVQKARTFLYSSLLCQNEELLMELLNNMSDGGIKTVLLSDKLLRQHACLRMESMGTLTDQTELLITINHVKTPIYLLATLIRAMRKKVPKITLDQLLTPSAFDLVVETTRLLATRKDGRSGGLVHRLAYVLKQAALTKIGVALRNGNEHVAVEVEQFIALVIAEWNNTVNRAAEKLERQTKVTNVINYLPLIDDLVLFRDHLLKKITEYGDLVRTTCETGDWISLANMTMARLITFNKRQPSNVTNIRLLEYTNRPDWQNEFEGEMSQGLTAAERSISKRMDMVLSAGGRSDNVQNFVLITPDARQAIDLLVATRAAVGVHESNTFLFAQPAGKDAKQQPVQLKLSDIARECPSLEHPERITPINLRKYMASMSQVIGINKEQEELLARHLGYDQRVQNKLFRLSSSTVELSKVSQLLIAVDNGRLHEINNLRDVLSSDLTTFDNPDGVDDFDMTSILETEQRNVSDERKRNYALYNIRATTDLKSSPTHCKKRPMTFIDNESNSSMSDVEC